MADENTAIDLGLLRRARSDDMAAKEELIRKYLPMVKHIVRQHYASFLDSDDLCQEGLIGLLHAMETYNSDDYSVKFSSFAYLCILRKIYNAIKQTNGSKHRALNEAISLHTSVAQDESRTVMDCLVVPTPIDDPAHVVDDKLRTQRLRELLKNHLSVLEFAVISLLVQGYSCSEIQRAIGVSGKAVDNARTRVKSKLKRILDRYGSLESPHVPDRSRRRRDLFRELKVRVGQG